MKPYADRNWRRPTKKEKLRMYRVLYGGNPDMDEQPTSKNRPFFYGRGRDPKIKLEGTGEKATTSLRELHCDRCGAAFTLDMKNYPEDGKLLCGSC